MNPGYGPRPEPFVTTQGGTAGGAAASIHGGQPCLENGRFLERNIIFVCIGHRLDFNAIKLT